MFGDRFFAQFRKTKGSTKPSRLADFIKAIEKYNELPDSTKKDTELDDIEHRAAHIRDYTKKKRGVRRVDKKYSLAFDFLRNEIKEERERLAQIIDRQIVSEHKSAPTSEKIFPSPKKQQPSVPPPRPRSSFRQPSERKGLDRKEEEKVDLRIRKSAEIYCSGPQKLYASQEMIDAANAALSAAGAFISLYPDPKQIGFHMGKSLHMVKLRWNSLTAPKGGWHKQLGDLNGRQVTGQYYSHADCHRNAQTVMGSDSGGAVIDTERAVIALRGNPCSVLPQIMKKEAKAHGTILNDSHANRGVYSFFCNAFALFLEELDKIRTNMKAYSISGGNLSALEDRLKDIAGAKKLEVQNVSKSWTAYKIIQDHPQVARLFAQKFGVNEDTAPQVGEALVQVNNEIERKEERVKDYWNFHWAGVIMTTGEGNYVTFENLSVEDDDVKNTKWYFRLCGPGAHSFHAQAKQDIHVGKYPITLRFKSLKVPEEKLGMKRPRKVKVSPAFLKMLEGKKASPDE